MAEVFARVNKLIARRYVAVMITVLLMMISVFPATAFAMEDEYSLDPGVFGAGIGVEDEIPAFEEWSEDTFEGGLNLKATATEQNDGFVALSNDPVGLSTNLTPQYIGPTGGKFLAPIEPIPNGVDIVEVNQSNIRTVNWNQVDKYYVLIEDIDLSSAPWTQISTFTGTLDGRGYVIRNLTATGLFYQASSSVIKNIGLEGISIYNTTLNTYTGGICGYLYESSINNCYSMGTISVSSTYVGGICGYGSSSFGSISTGTISNCYNTAIISASVISSGLARVSAGGICGYQNWGLIPISNCYNTGDISAYSGASDTSNDQSLAYAGGILGENGGTISNCYNTGDISAVSVGSPLPSGYGSPSYAYAGGILGGDGANISNCYNAGDISADSSLPSTEPKKTSYAYAGGICGNLFTISNCYNTGDVSASCSCSSDAQTSEAYAGGICGEAANTSNCYNTGNVSALVSVSSEPSSSSGPSYAYAGGICGEQHNSIENCCNTGTVYASSDYGYATYAVAGGICGEAISSDIHDCYNMGDISAYSATFNAMAGGICGGPGYSSGTTQLGYSSIKNCYNVGAISASSDYGYTYASVGAICSSTHAYSTESNYYWREESEQIVNNYHRDDNEKRGISADTISGRLPDAQMKEQGNYPGWDFDNVWGFKSGENGDFPVLRVFYDLPSNWLYTDDGSSITITGYLGSSTAPKIPSTIDTKPVTVIGASAFYDFTSLTGVVIPNSIVSIENKAFYGCTNLKSVTIPDSVLNIDSEAFCGCENLTEVYFDGNAPEVGINTFTGTAFGAIAYVYDIATGFPAGGQYWNNLTIKYRTPVVGDVFTVDGITYKVITFSGDTGTVQVGTDNGTLIAVSQDTTTVAIPETVSVYWATYEVTSVGNYAFTNCSSLTDVTIPDSVTDIGIYAFYGCNNLISVTLPESIASSMTSIGHWAFYNCSSLTDVTIPDSVTSIGNYVFYNCSSLTNVTIPDGVTSIGYNLFYGCSSLVNVTFPASVNMFRSDYAFYNCSRLTSVTIPAGVTYIGSYAFYGCGNLVDITIPDSVTSIGNYAFYGCYRLLSVTIPDKVTKIGDYAFRGCTRLASVSIPNGVESIGDWAFYNCANLTSVSLPSSLISVGEQAFAYSYNLSEVYFGGNAPTVDTDAFNNLASGAVAYVPSNATGFSAEGQLWNGLVVRYHNIGQYPTVTVSGTVVSNNPKNATTVQLLQGATVKYTATIAVETGSGQKAQAFSINEVEAGDYTLKITKPGHLSYTKTTLTVGIADIAYKEVVLTAGDLNDDGAINAEDYLVFRSNYGRIAPDTPGDINGDGTVNAEDYLLFRNGYGKSPVVES